MVDEEYAMKKYSKYHIAKNGKQLSLIRSVRILNNLSNCGIIDFIHFIIGKQDEIFLIFQACKKGSLEDIKISIFKNRYYDLIKEIMYQLAKCLEYLKSVSVAHRDIKPSNIAFNSKGELKIIDFDEAVCFREDVVNNSIGFSEQFSQEIVDLRLTARRSRTNSYVGTQMYMSPEMKQRTGSDERGDIWAFGCILYELIQGQSILIQSQDEEEMQTKLLSYLRKMDNENPIIRDLLRKILVLNPNKRSSIEQILKHKYFDEYRVKNFDNKRKLTKFLRGNYNLMDPRTVIDALKMDLIGMKAGQQIFQLLNTPILLQKQFSFWQRIFRVNMPCAYVLVGGGRYFKLKNPLNENQKIYIFYDEIDNIYIKDDLVCIKCTSKKNHLKSGYLNSKEMVNEKVYKFKHILNSQEDKDNLGRLYKIIHYIWND